MDIWTLLVVNLAGSFWMAVFLMMALMYLIFIMGSVSHYTALTFLSIFFWVMCLSYGFLLYGIVATVLLIITHVYAIPKLINSASK